MPELYDLYGQLVREGYARLPSYTVENTPIGNPFYKLTSHTHDGRNSTGWKVYLSIHPEDVPRAWNLIAQYATMHGIEAAKVTTPAATQRFANPEYEQSGKMITLYDSGEPEWENKIPEIEKLLAENGIRPGPAIKNVRSIAGSRYAGYRNDRNTEYGQYIPADQLNALPPAKRYNPYNEPDKFADVDVSSVYTTLSSFTSSADAAEAYPPATGLSEVLARKFGREVTFSGFTTGDNPLAFISAPWGFSHHRLAEIGIDATTSISVSSSDNVHTFKVPVESLPDNLRPTAGQKAAVENLNSALSENFGNKVRVIRYSDSHVTINVPLDFSRRQLAALGISPDSITRFAGPNGTANLAVTLNSLPREMRPVRTYFQSLIPAKLGPEGAQIGRVRLGGPGDANTR